MTGPGMFRNGNDQHALGVMRRCKQSEGGIRYVISNLRLDCCRSYHSGQVRYIQTPATPPATVGLGLVGSPYYWPYDYTYNPHEYYCGASYVVSW